MDNGQPIDPDAFLPREKFERLKAAGEIQPDCIFPVLDYDVCRQIWYTSPLINALRSQFKQEINR